MEINRHRPVSHRRAALYALAVMAAFVRVVFAPGYMPQTTPDGSPLSLVICTPGGIMSVAPPGLDGSSVAVDPPCAFAAVTALSAPPDAVITPLPRLFPRALDRAAPPLRDSVPTASPLPLGARAPPRLA